MDIEERIRQTESKFEELQGKRDQHRQSMQDLDTELVKLQGEWRVLQELLPEKKGKNPKQANTIEAIPAKVVK